MQSSVRRESIEYSIKFIEIRELKRKYRIHLQICIQRCLYSDCIIEIEEVKK